MTKQDDNKKPATTEARNKDETQKLSPSSDGSQKLSDSSVTKEILLKEIDELKKKVEDFENKYKRALADYQNLEKRVAGERKEWILRANKDLLLHLLPVLDTLREAAKHVQNEGLTLSIKQFEDVLRNEGVEKIETSGKQFDPKLMRCVETKTGEEGKVLDEVRTGYKYKVDNTLLREADVTVGKEKLDIQAEEKAKVELGKGDYM